MEMTRYLILILATLVASQGTTDTDDLESYPTINEVFHNISATFAGVHNITSDCAVIVEPDNSCHIEMTTDPAECLPTVTLLRVLFRHASQMIQDVEKVLSSKTYVQRVDLDSCRKLLQIKNKVEGSMDLIPGFIRADNVSVGVTVNGTWSTAVNLASTGQWTVGSLKFTVQMQSEEDGFSVTGTPTEVPGPGLVRKFISEIRQTIFPDTHLVETFTFLKFNELSLKDISLRAKSRKQDSEVRFSFTLVDSGLKNPRIHLSLIRLRHQNKTSLISVVGGIFSNVNIQHLFRKLTNIDVSAIPFVGKTNVSDVKMLFSPDSITQQLIPYDDPELTALLPHEQGIQFVMGIQFKSGTSINKVHVSVWNKFIKFKIHGDSGLSVSAFLDTIISKYKITNLPPHLSLQEFLDLRVTGFYYNWETKLITIPAMISRPITLIRGAVALSDVTLKFTVCTGSNSPTRENCSYGVDVKCTWKLGKYNLPLTIHKPNNANVFIAESKPNVDIPFGQMIKQFATSLLPGGPLRDGVRQAGIDSFFISDPYLKMYLSEDAVMKVQGRTVIGVWDKCKAEIMIGKVSGASVMVTGLVIEQVPITKVIYKITDGQINLGRLPGASILDNTDVSIVMSSQPVPRAQQYMRFSTPSLSSIEILDGVSLSGSFKFPQNCDNDQFCQVSKRLLGKNAQLVLKGRLAVASVYLSATVPTEIQIFRGVNITDVGFEVETGLSRSGIGIKGALKLRDPPLTFIGAFGISTSGVYLSMSMAGVWKNPFRVPYLAIGNLHFRVAIAPTPTLINALAFGGQARLGKFEDPNAKPVEAKMYVGIDTVSPSENYFHAKFSPLTIRAFLEAFAYRPSLPKPLAEIGFPKGLFISYALKSKILPNGVSINRGFYLQGMMKVLFFEANCNIRLSLNGIFVNLTVAPFNIGKGLVSVSGRSSSMGPRMFVDIGWNPPRALIMIEGSLQILKIRNTVNITVDHRGMIFNISGKFLNLFDARFTVRSDDSSLKTADFQVSGYFRQNLLSRLEHEVRNSLDSYRKKADREIGNAQRKVDDAKKAFDAAANKIRGLQGKVNAEKAKFDAAVRDLESTKWTLERTKRAFDDANRKLTSAQHTVYSKKRAFDNAVRSLEAKKRSCPSTCRRRRAAGPFLQNDDAKGFLKRSKRGWGWGNPVEKGRERVEEGLEWSRERASEVREKTREAAENTREFTIERARETACATRRAAREVCLRGVTAIQWVVTQSKRSLDLAVRTLDGLKIIVAQSKRSMDVAKGFVTAAQFTVNKSKGLVDAAVYALKAAETITRNAKHTLKVVTGALEVAKQTNRFGVMVGQRIASLGLGGLLNIEELTFDVSLSMAQSGHFRGSMRAKIMGLETTFPFDIKLRAVIDMVQSLLEKVKDALGLRKKRSIQAHALTAIAELKPSNVNTHRVFLRGNASCKFYEEISEIISLVLNDTEDLTDTIKSLAQTRSRVGNSQVTTQDVDDLMRLGEEVLNTGLEAVMDLVAMETDMTEAELKQLLQEVGALGSDPCLKTNVHQLTQLLKPTTVELSVASIDKLLKELQQTAGCLDTHRCQADENGPE